MQQAVTEEASEFYEPSVRSYNDLFPALPTSTVTSHNNNSSIGRIHKMRVETSRITQVFHIPPEERKQESNKFGENESKQLCANVMKETSTHLEITTGKDMTLTFLVSGKVEQVNQARRRIISLFQTQANKSISIPKEHHRGILGPKGTKLRELEKGTETKITVPAMNDPSDVIVITGPKEGIEKAEHEIRVTSDEMSKKAYDRVSVPKIYHPFIVGPFSETMNAISAETGAKINVPPPSVMKDEIGIAGDKEGVAAAKARIEAIYLEKHKNCTTVQVEVPKAQHKYVIGPKRSTIAEILKETGVSVELPPSETQSGTITLRGPHDKLGLALSVVYDKANSVITNVINAPSWKHKHIIGKKGTNIKEITANSPKVHVEFNDRENQIKVTGPRDDVGPVHDQLKAIVDELVYLELNVDPKFYKHIIGKSGANVNRLKDVTVNIDNMDPQGCIKIVGTNSAVKAAHKELDELIKKLENETEVDVVVEQRHHKTIIGNKGQKIRGIRERFNQVQITFPDAYEKKDVIKIRGVRADVEQCERYLRELVKELNETSYQLEVPICKKFHRFIIGKEGVNIKNIREETQTKIELPSESDSNDVIIITGKRENVEEARDKIKKIEDELVNIVTEKITIDPKFYNSLIGTRGKLIHSIMEDCGGVSIKFPTVEDKTDKVTIRGPKEDVERAKQTLLDYVNEKQLSSYTDEVRAKAQHHRFLIGKNGSNIKKIRDSTGARVVFPTNADEDKELITIIGKKESVLEAKAQLQASIKEIDNTIQSEMTIDPKYHKHFMAKRCETLNKIRDDCGGVIISFPPKDDSRVPNDRVTLRGPKEWIDAAKKKIQNIMVDIDSQVTVECIIPQKMHRAVMGAKGYKLQGIEADYDVKIKFPDKNNIEEYVNHDGQLNGDLGEEPVRVCDVIHITGKQKNCEEAKQALLDLKPVTLDMDVPMDLHRSIIGRSGSYVKPLMEEFDVQIVFPPSGQKEDTIKISGTPSNCERAREAILEKVKEIEAERKDKELKSFSVSIEVDPKFHPKIIGKRGAVITGIREKHNVQINLNRRGGPNEQIITITGYEANAHLAQEDIMKIVNELNSQRSEEVAVDGRVHNRLIGQKGRSIKKIMDDYKVDVIFPKTTDPDPNMVTIIGSDENVYEAKEHILQLAEEFMQDILEKEMYSNYRAPERKEQQMPASGFVVAGGPWEQQAPNTESVTEFPSFGGGRGLGSNITEPPPPQVSSPIGGVWGNVKR